MLQEIWIHLHQIPVSLAFLRLSILPIRCNIFWSTCLRGTLNNILPIFEYVRTLLDSETLIVLKGVYYPQGHASLDILANI